MEYWYELFYAYVKQQGIFIDRGDPPAHDFTLVNFTTDATWRDLDLSAIVPINAKAVLMFLQIADNLVGSRMNFREKGNANFFNQSETRTQVANFTCSQDILCAVDSNRVIQYNGSNLVFNSINLTVRGWWY